jgi:hypothetical protein
MNPGRIAFSGEADHLLRKLSAALLDAGDYDSCLEIAEICKANLEADTAIFDAAAVAAIKLKKLDEAVAFLARALRSVEGVQLQFVGEWHRALIRKYPRLRAAIDVSPARDYFHYIGKLRKAEPPDVRSEQCRIEDFWLDQRVSLPPQARAVLFDYSRKAALDLLENPPLNPIEYWFSRSYDDPAVFHHPAGGAQLLQLLEIMLASGEARWIAGELRRRAPRLAVVAAMSGHPRLVRAAEAALKAPDLGRVLDRLRQSRHGPADHVEIGDYCAAQEQLIHAVGDAIRRYSLTVDVNDGLISPLGFFDGFNRANPGKLAYCFTRAPDAYPLFHTFLIHWAFGRPLPWGNFHHPHAAMLYTRCYHYRAAIVSACIDPALLREKALDRLVRRLDDEVGYIQSGPTLGFRNDTRGIAADLIRRFGRASARRRLQKHLKPRIDRSRYR